MSQLDTVVVPQVRTHGRVPSAMRVYAVEKAVVALQHTADPVLFVRLNLDSVPTGNRVDAHVDVNGTALHVHAFGETLQEAVDVMQERLRSSLRRLRRRPHQGPAAPAGPHRWRSTAAAVR